MADLIDVAQSGVEAFSWCETLFSQIEKEAEALRGDGSRIKHLAEVGGYLTAVFGNDLDVAREECEGVQS